MKAPLLLEASDFQKAWIAAARYLSDNSWEARNLMVHIKNVATFDSELHQDCEDFCKKEGLLVGPKDVAYTIFPHGLYKDNPSAKELFRAYNRERGMFKRLQHKPRKGWGTYFRRMTHYDTKKNNAVNQLQRIIQAINDRDDTYRAAYTVVIQIPGGENVRPLGGPCLNYLALQMEKANPDILNLLAVYRHHDFLERAYGNYWGLCNLVRFLANETNTSAGRLTCLSSRAYIDKHKLALGDFLETLP